MYPRFVERRVRESLGDTRVVLLCGPRQSGKTTLAQRIATDAIPFVTLDDATALDAASADPVGFVRGLDRAVIDEVQRAPDLILAIKTAVDADPRPGRFLLTGSADLMTLPRVADSLAGRMGIVRLLPLAQAELHDALPSFLDKTFSGQPPTSGAPVVGDDLVETVLAGGYPEALTRATWRRRQSWHLDYIEAILQRDLRDIARIEQLDLMPGLLRVLAEYSGQLVNYSGFGAPLGMNHVTTRKYVGLLENLFLVQSVPIRLSPTPTICMVWRQVAREADEAEMDVSQREDLSFPRSLSASTSSTFRFNRRFYPFNAFRSLFEIAGDVTAPTYAELYSGDWEHPKCSRCG